MAPARGEERDMTKEILEQLRFLSTRYTEGDISRMFIEESLKKISQYSKVDVAVVGAGPAGLTAAYYLCKSGLKTIILEKNLGVGGGIRGGGMLLPLAVVEEGEATRILSEVGVRTYNLSEGLVYIDPTEAMTKLAAKIYDMDGFIWPGVYVEDVIARVEDETIEIRGVVINWAPIYEADWHIDPLMIESKAVIDSTGHDADVIRIISMRYPKMNIEVPGMASMDIWKGEGEVIMRSGKLFKGLYVAGMSTAEVFHSHRMGPILGGMILSGKKVAYEIIKDLSE